MNHPARTDIVAVWLTNRSADAFFQWLANQPAGTVKDMLTACPKRSYGKHFHESCHKDTIACVELSDGAGYTIEADGFDDHMRKVYSAKEAKAQRRRRQMLVVDGDPRNG